MNLHELPDFPLGEVLDKVLTIVCGRLAADPQPEHLELLREVRARLDGPVSLWLDPPDADGVTGLRLCFPDLWLDPIDSHAADVFLVSAGAGNYEVAYMPSRPDSPSD